MFGPVGGFEILVLAAIGLLVFGPRRLPEIGRMLGRTMAEFRKAAAEMRASIEREIDLEEMKEAGRSIARALPTDALQEAAAELTRPPGGPPSGSPGGPGGAGRAPEANATGEGEGRRAPRPADGVDPAD